MTKVSIIIQVPKDIRKEIKLQALEDDETMKDFLYQIIYGRLIYNLSIYSETKKAQNNITDDDIKQRLRIIRESGLNG